MPAWLLNIIATVVIPFIVQLLKKWLGGSKFAPYIALALAGIYVAIAKAMGIESDINTVYQAILLAIGIGASSIAGYDIVKSLTTPTK